MTITPMEAELLRVALAKMFKPTGYFDYCLVERACKLAGVIAPARTMDTLHLIHCVHWNEMPETARLAVFETVMGLFQHTGFDLSALEATVRPAPVLVLNTLRLPRSTF